MDTGSVSKGCFSFKGRKKQANIDDYFPLKESKKSLDVYDSVWEDVNTEIQILQSDLNTKIFDDLITFVNSSPQNEGARQNYKEIPTAAVVAGVNTPDHSVMFATMVSLLRERSTPLVAILKSKDCPNLKSMLTKALSQLMDNPELMEEDLDEEEVKSKGILCSMTLLSSWYSKKFGNGESSPRKFRSSSNIESSPKKKACLSPTNKTGGSIPIVIVFEDLESFSPIVLQDFIGICSNYLHKLPLVLVFGIATSVAAVHRLLPSTVSSLLSIEKFQAPRATDYLTLLINQVLMTDRFPFKLGASAFQLLIEMFLFHDFSVLNFIRGLQFAMSQHYSSSVYSVLCCPIDTLPKKLKSLSSSQLDQVRQIPSFMKYVEGCPPNQQKSLLLEEEFTKNRILQLLQEIHHYHKNFFPVLKCLHILVCKLPTYPLGKQMREVYELALKSSIFESDAYARAIGLLRMMAAEELTDLLRQCHGELPNNIAKDLVDVPSSITSLLDQFKHLTDFEEEVTEVEQPDVETVAIPKKTDLYSLRQKLKDMEKKSKKLSPYEKLREETINFFDELFRKHLCCPKSFPLHEILYYDRADVLKRHLSATPRAAIQNALSNPHHYLECQCCTSDSGSLHPLMPDICIVYRLHLECGQLINLYDWLQAFATVVSEGEENNNSETINEILQARFIRAVSELQFLGFVKPTKRKTDHVARLTWGGC
ncbi:hypothetical protein ScPMuIL_013367 [Solemya velum]